MFVMLAKHPRKTVAVIVVIWLAVLLPCATMRAERKGRFLIHTFREGHAMMVVAIGDTSSGPKVAVLVKNMPNVAATDVTRVTRRGCAPTPFASLAESSPSFGISQAQFDRLWSRFTSSGAENYPISPTSSKEFDIEFYYTFDVGDKCYAVPRWKASQALTSLVTQLRAYAKKLQP
jgi:hypothetical protein